MNPEFRLEEWEWPPGQERRYILEPFEYQHKHELGLKTLAICAVPYRADLGQSLVFFKEKPVRGWGRGKENGQDEEPHYVIVENIHKTPHWRLRTWLIPQQSQTLPTAFPRDGTLQRIRVFHFPRASALIGENRALWTSENPRITHFVPPPETEKVVSKVIFRWLQHQLESDSETHFAYQWHLKSREQRLELLSDVLPSLREILRIMRLVVQNEPLITEQDVWSLGEPNSYPNLYCENRPDVQVYLDILLRLRLWSQLLHAQFPLPRLAAESNPLCLSYPHTDLYSLLQIKGEIPTAHERLEARVFLREWVKNKVSPEEMSRLFATAE